MKNDSATLMVNLAARGVPADLDWSRVVRFLRKQGIEARLTIPDSPEDARHEAHRSAKAGDRWLFVVGGDGSLRVAAAGLAGSETALAALPLGTVNVWARETGIPRTLRAALECHLDGQVTAIDLGRGGDECFLLMASAGWDAAVARDVPAEWKRRLGDVAYVLQGARMLRGLHGNPVIWSADGAAQQSNLAMLVVSNTRLYGGRVMFTPHALADDGLFDYVALEPRHAGDTIGLAAHLTTKHLHHSEHASGGQAREVTIETPGLAVQFDGDYIGETPITLHVEPASLRVSIPKGPLPPCLNSSAAQP